MDMIEGQVFGTQTSAGFIPHLEISGQRMPIMVEVSKGRSINHFPKPRIYGNTSVWALPGGFQYVHRDPIKIS